MRVVAVTKDDHDLTRRPTPPRRQGGLECDPWRLSATRFNDFRYPTNPRLGPLIIILAERAGGAAGRGFHVHVRATCALGRWLAAD